MIVTAVASMTSHGVLGDDADLNHRILDAMVAAVQECQARGETDPEVIRKAQIDARDRVVAQG